MKSMVYQSKQSGMALIISLILLAVITIIGLAGIQTTSMQEVMTANQYDRELSFQAAETALREAEARLRDDPDDFQNDCSSVLCNPMPPVNAQWQAATSNLGGLVSAPQFYIERMGFGTGTATGTEPSQGADSLQYGGSVDTGTPTSAFYRVTARSAVVDGRASVVLQTMVVRNL